jgi:hypothetical protein
MPADVPSRSGNANMTNGRPSLELTLGSPPHTPSKPILEGVMYRESTAIPGVAKKRSFVLYPYALLPFPSSRTIPLRLYGL